MTLVLTADKGMKSQVGGLLTAEAAQPAAAICLF